jgi:NAD(P) transhydrogenase subunit beta
MSLGLTVASVAMSTMIDAISQLVLIAQTTTSDVAVAEPGWFAPQNRDVVARVGYLIASVLFIIGLKGLTHPRTAVRGNLLGAVGMLIAVVVTLLVTGVSAWVWFTGILVGTAIGVWLALTVQMTQMPQFVALFNGFGGIASVLVAGVEILHTEYSEEHFHIHGFAAGLTILIGAVTFSGSLVAAGKLQELDMFRKPWSFPKQQIANAGMLAVSALLIYEMADNSAWEYFPILILSLILGVLLTIPIGGADMPVVIALLNSYSGLAASAAGFVIGNNVLIIAGALVGASGIILTQIMCKAMNRSLTSVLFGKFEPAVGGPTDDEVYAGKIKSSSPDEVAMLLDGVQRVVIVPGYGLAVSQAQHTVRELADLLEARGVTVEYAIHPVAGRMPGHMNVLLAEADVPYDQLKEMDEINPTFAQCDVAIVIGANDVVNPLANTDPTSPIAGMPILNVSAARNVVVVKRSLSPGFAGIPNPLFAADNCLMLFGDGKKAMVELVAALKEG